MRSLDIRRELLQLRSSEQLRHFLGGFAGMSYLEETLRETQNLLEISNVSHGLGTPLDSLGAGKHCWGK